MSAPRRYDRPRGRFNKQVRVRRKRYGLWWEGFGVSHKVVSVARQTEEGIKIGDIVSKFDKDENRLVTITVKGVYTYGNPPQKVYTFDLAKDEIMTPAKGWKRTEIKEFPYKLLLSKDPSIRWKGEWRFSESSIKYPAYPYKGAVPSPLGMVKVRLI